MGEGQDIGITSKNICSAQRLFLYRIFISKPHILVRHSTFNNLIEFYAPDHSIIIYLFFILLGNPLTRGQFSRNLGREAGLLLDLCTSSAF